jgi:SAM-dependent methyltransferase
MIRRMNEKALAAYQRFVPAARPWQRIGDFVTFSSRGFVAAQSPEELLARHNYEITEIGRVLDDNRFRRSLEIGCGFGRLSQHLGRNSSFHLGIDINPKALGSARRLYPDVHYGLASVTGLPFADSSFDLVTTWTVMQHLPPSYIAGALTEIARVATADALLVLCEEVSHADAQDIEKWHTHTWHRHPVFYAECLTPYRLQEHRPVPGFAPVGLPPPGEVMLFRAGSALI